MNKVVTRSQKGSSTRSNTEEETSTATETSGVTTSEEITESSECTEETTMKGTGADATMVAKNGTAKSKSSKAANKRKELEARMELEELKLAEIKAKAQLASTKLELARMNEDTDLSDDGVDPEAEAAAAKATAAWVTKTKKLGNNEERSNGKDQCNPSSAEAPPATSQTNQLAEAIIQAVKTVADSKTSPALQRAPKYVSELHPFDGDARDWMAFKATYMDTQALFSAVENMGRLRRTIKGKAKDAVKSLLFTQVDPEEVLSALERRFGRPSYLIRSEIENIEKLPPMSEDAKELVRYAGAVANTVSVVKQMKKQNYLHSSDISNIIIEKMCTLVRFKWYEYKATREEDEPILISLMNFFNQMVDQFELHKPVSSRVKREGWRTRLYPSGSRGIHVTRATLYGEEGYSTQEDSEEEQEYTDDRTKTETVCSCQEGRKYEREKIVCPQCEEEHTLLKCKKFTEASVQERWEQAKKTGTCFKCLQRRHRRFNCRAKPCAKCRRGHHTLLHSEEAVNSKTQEDTQRIASTVNAAQTISRAYLKIVPVELVGPEANAHVYALLDEGSTVTLVEEEIINKIGAKGPEEELKIEGVGGHRMDQKSKKIDIKIKGLFARNYERMTGYTMKNLHLTPQEISEKDIENCPHLKEIADQLKYANARPTVLIGQDNWNLIVSQEVKRGERNKPVASRTQLGWVLHGVRLSTCVPLRIVNHLVTKPERDDYLERMIKNHFEIEALGVDPKKPSSDIDQRALNILDSVTKRLTDGRFSTGLMWKTDNEEMPESRIVASRRLRGIEKKFLINEEFKRNYEEQIENLIKNQYAEETEEEPTSPRTWYLPHFAVVHPQKRKMRLVFDAAAKSNGKSLNDALLSGPDLLQSLIGVLIRFRQRAVAVVADIKEMFLRIKINEEDRDSLRFLWKDKEYRMTSLIFGAACSPCTAIYVINKNATDFAETHPDAVKAIRRNHYMDDYLASFPDIRTATKVSREVDQVHKSGGFVLRGWASNEPAAIEEFSENKQNRSIRLGEQQDQIEKTLGLNWNTNKDSLHFTVNLRNTPAEAIQGHRAPTKREATSAVMSVFDPLGLASPVTIPGKMMLQSLWRAGVGWDEKIPTEREEEWRKWLHGLKTIETLHIPRCLTRDVTEGELHTFCDASEKAFACAVYWRTQHPDGHVEVKLLTAKARVSPLKPISIPRLELQACLLGSRLTASTQQEMDFDVTQRYFWTDSRTALAWIKSEPRRYKSFVAHRLAEIEDLTKQKEWRWVPTKYNVADDATRDTPANFTIAHRWFTGPQFLYEDPKDWPVDTSSLQPKETGEERSKIVLIMENRKEINIDIPNPTHFSKWTRLLRATARFLQAIDIFKSHKGRVNVTKRITRKTQDVNWKKNLKKKKEKPTSRRSDAKQSATYIPLSIDYIKKAERLLIQKIQSDSFSGEIYALKNKKEIKRTSRLKSLTLKLEDNMLRLSTRVGAAKYLTESYKSPIILDGKHPITRLLVEYLHAAFGHGNNHTVLNEIRQKYWVTSLRSLVRSVARNCGWCRLNKGTPQQVPTGDLPLERLTKEDSPFTCTAVDYFGPMTVTVGRRTEKRWGALFTCLTTRAIHLELASSLSTDSMILALRRMIARRGTPRVIFSDNGTNFIGANKEIALSIQNMKEAVNGIGITWKFIPPGAPNMGGSWERMVRSVKVALAATLHERRPREEILHTVLLEAEHIVNSRPLFQVNLEPSEEEEALTPNHFLIGKSCGAALFGNFDDHTLIGTPTWRTSQRLADHFWSRWVREYLPTLSPRYHQGPHYRDPAIDDLVLIADHTLPRCSWPRGKIIRTYPGPDGRTRVVDVRTTAGVLRRPTSRLVIIVPASTSTSSPQSRKVQRTEGETVGD